MSLQAGVGGHAGLCKPRESRNAPLSRAFRKIRRELTTLGSEHPSTPHTLAQQRMGNPMLKRAMNLPWLAIVMGVASTIIGIVLTAMNAGTEAANAGTYLILGGILTAFGPVVVSHAISKELGREEARAELLKHVESVSMNLGQSVAALDNAFRRNAAKVDDSTVTLSIAHSIVNSIEVQIGQLQKLIGEPFSAESFVATKKELVSLASVFSKAVETDDPNAVVQASRGIQKAVRKLVKPASEGLDETVHCPNCRHAFQQQLASIPGATAHATCPHCEALFLVHRDGQGAVFVRVAAGTPVVSNPVRVVPPAAEPQSAPTSAAKKTFVVCPECGKDVRFWLDGSQADQTVVCLSCDTGIEVDGAGNTRSHTAYRRQPVSILRTVQRNYVATCPGCGEERACRIRLDGQFFGLCATDKLTLVISAAEVAEHTVGNAIDLDAAPRR